MSRAASREAAFSEFAAAVAPRLFRSALLMCGDRPGEKYSKPVKGTQNSRNADPTRGFSR